MLVRLGEYGVMLEEVVEKFETNQHPKTAASPKGQKTIWKVEEDRTAQATARPLLAQIEFIRTRIININS